MKKIALFGGLAVILIVLTAAVRFYYINLRGVGPVVNPAPEDITTQIPGIPKSAQNLTNLPLQIPAGFTVSVFAKNLGGARVLAWDPTGTLLVSIPGQGKVMAIVDSNGDGAVDDITTVISGLNKPHGLAFHDGRLYIAEMDKVAVYDYDAATKKAANKQKILDLPSGGNHTSRTIGFGPDGKLYVAVGSSCNACVEKDPRRAAISVANPDGSNAKIFASGLRNAVFFAWSPYDSRMWASNMGRDLIGDDVPPETVNIVSEGKNFGWPYCYGQRIWDKTFDSSKKAEEFCKTVELPHIEYQAHAAPLGLAFTPKSWPKAYQNSLLVAFHGSWNRTVPTGYTIVRFQLDSKGNYVKSEDFISGWLTSGGALGRPVDLLFDTQGVLYVSDDKIGVIYRVVYNP
jgi:glucose/arabinose dehydrogenase